MTVIRGRAITFIYTDINMKRVTRTGQNCATFLSQRRCNANDTFNRGTCLCSRLPRLYSVTLLAVSPRACLGRLLDSRWLKYAFWKTGEINFACARLISLAVQLGLRARFSEGVRVKISRLSIVARSRSVESSIPTGNYTGKTLRKYISC